MTYSPVIAYDTNPIALGTAAGQIGAAVSRSFGVYPLSDLAVAEMAHAAWEKYVEDEYAAGGEVDSDWHELYESAYVKAYWQVAD